ncbi:BRCA1-associated RING domain protein 1 [Frankliniella fusca]|uniref:BRCA1-associated RING domain protein 1 n=1 Tax=Frankliniella fusca TaxID=407009 RepID=A0AAE1LPN7_9NEOP|nr:BRCA1-associated RING domain protein 1 [Frankliniella fusca]
MERKRRRSSEEGEDRWEENLGRPSTPIPEDVSMVTQQPDVERTPSSTASFGTERPASPTFFLDCVERPLTPTTPTVSSTSMETTPTVLFPLASSRPPSPAPSDPPVDDSSWNKEPELFLPEEASWDEFYEAELLSLDESYLVEEGEKYIYEGAPLTLHESLVSILTLAMTFALSGQCIQSLLKLIYLHCSKVNNIFKKSLHLFKIYFSDIRGTIDYQYFCSGCLEECPDKKCKICQPGTALCYLIKMPLIPQLQAMLNREGFYSKLEDVQKRISAGFSDIFDGFVYKHHVKLGLLGLRNQLSFMWYTDGAAVFSPPFCFEKA